MKLTPGQQYGAEILPDAYGYPNMDDLAEQVTWKFYIQSHEGSKRIPMSKFYHLPRKANFIVGYRTSKCIIFLMSHNRKQERYIFLQKGVKC
jgi:hypothetical protein